MCLLLNVDTPSIEVRGVAIAQCGVGEVCRGRERAESDAIADRSSHLHR